jgi:hypothetical protein
VKVIQLTPAERGWHVCTNIAQEGAEPLRVKYEVACWALVDDGRVLPMIYGDGPGLYVVEEDGAQLYAPGESYEYAATSIYQKGALNPPDDSDWELVTAAAGSTDENPYLVWRRPYR